jgi:hypothetical protein
VRFKKIKTLAFKGGQTSVFPFSLGKASSTVAAYIFTAPTFKATIISLEPCALNADFQHFIPRELPKFPYFMDYP